MDSNKTLIEEFFPINAINEIAKKESRAKQYYRPIYTMHKWWARRLGSVFRSILLYSLLEEDDINNKDFSWYSRQLSFSDLNKSSFKNKQLNIGDQKNIDVNQQWKDLYLKDWNLNKTVLDPFMGGGTTIVEGLRLGCNVIGCELNPVAWFTVKKEIEQIDIDKLEEEFKKLEKNIAPEILKYYKTNCPECNHEAEAMGYFWIKELKCLNCGEVVPLFKDYRLAKSRIKNKKGYWVICPKCEEIFISYNYKGTNNCPNCNLEFNPTKDGITTGGFFTCPSCGQKNKILEVVDKKGYHDQRIYAIEYYCNNCDKKNIGGKTNGKKYKKANKKDKLLYKKAEKEYQNKRELLFPQQIIPAGVKTKSLINHGFHQWSDLFNSRHLFSIGILLDSIKKIKQDDIKELMILVLSESLRYNNELCTYNKAYNKINPIFMSHAFIPRVDHVENNFWGSKYGIGNFTKAYKMVTKAIKYKNKPFEKYIDNNKIDQKQMKNKINGVLTDSFGSLGSDGNSLLLNHTSEDLNEIPNKSIDAVVTDPPYYDNVMYSELSDFFYVILRKILKENYNNFQSNLTPKYSEVIKNKVQNKSDKEYIEGLTRVFKESRKKLIDDGIMIFTFHHQDNKAWGAVLKSVLDAGFYISAMYPIQAEMATSTHIKKQANVEYDVIIVCRKQLQAPKDKSWNKLKDKISFQIDDIIKNLEKKDKEISLGDIFVIALGKCLEIYSQHYPNVIQNGEKVSVKQAIEDVQQLIDLEISYERMQNLTSELDWITAIYLSFIVGRGNEISYSTLNKELSSRNIDINELIEANLLEKDGSMLRILSPEERRQYLEPGNLKSAIDKADYLYNMVKEEKLKSTQAAITEDGYKVMQKLVDKDRGDKKVCKKALKIAKRGIQG